MYFNDLAKPVMAVPRALPEKWLPTKTLLVMKLISILILGALLNVNAKGISQNVSFSGKDVPLKKIFNVLKQQTGYVFFYDGTILKNTKPVTVNVSNVPLETFLQQVLRDQPLKYLIENRAVIISRKPLQAPSPVEQLTEPLRMPEAVPVSGIVTSAGKPVPGVSVVVKGSKKGTVTDGDGRYTLNVPSGSSTLVFSYVGFEAQEVPVNNLSAINVELVASPASLNDMVVIGYGSVKRKDLTGAVSSLKTADITAIPVSNAIEALQGKVSGLDLTRNDGQAGAALSFTLRGNRSLKASNAPLILVDGITYGSTMDINTSDIASIEVLKDASSTAIYGSRGSNGVILITTKRGKAGKPAISLNSYYGIQSPAGLPDIQTGPEYVAFKRQAYRTAGITNDATIFSAAELAAISQGNYRDWRGEILQNGSIQNHELSMYGGNDKITYNLSFGGFNEKSLIRNDRLRRYNGSLGLTYKFSENFRLGSNLIYTYRNNDKRYDPLNMANKILPFGKPYDSAGNIITYPVPGSSFAISPLADEAPGAYTDNIIGKRLFSSSFMDLTILPKLLFRSTFGLDIITDREGFFFGKNSIVQNGTTSKSGVNMANETNYTWENTLNYTIDMGVHNFALLAGNSIIKNSREEFGASGNDQVSELNSYYNLGSNASTVVISSKKRESGLKSFFGRVNYRLMDKYLLTASFRADGSSVLAKGHKWGYYPSVAAAWKLSDEGFMNSLTTVSTLKLRASYGISGNSSVDPYQTLGSLGRSVYAFDETAAYGYYPLEIANPELKWENTTTANLGLDFGLLNDRITGSVEYYQSKTKDLLMQRILPSTSGFTSILENVGKTKNKGVEITVSTQNVAAASPRGFSWSTDFTYSRNKEEIVELASGTTRDLANFWFTGQPTQVYYDYQKTGIWQLGKEADAAKYGQKPGDIQVKDVNNDGAITSNDDRVIVGTNRPKYTAGLNNRLKYRDFDLTFFLYARVGQTIQNEASGNYKINGMENGPVVDYWTPENATNDHPRPDKDKTANSAYMSTLYYVNGSFLKVRDITLGYALPSALVRSAALSRVRAYVTLKNFFTISHIGPYDPERGGSLSFPMTKQVVFGINVDLK